MRTRHFVAGLIALVVLVPVRPAIASLPGTDGVIVFSYEAPVPTEGLTQSDLYTIAPDGSDVVRLTSTPSRNEMAPAWSPDGTRIAFMRTKAPFGHGSIWTMAADGSDQRRVTTGVDVRDPVWSPNGRRLAVTWFSELSGRWSPDIATIPSDGGRPRALTTWPSRESMPGWSPDGASIVFTRGFDTGDVGDLWTIDLATGRRRQITSSPGYDLQAGWSPDGSLVLFQRTFDTTSKIAVVAPDGTGFTALTHGHFDADPAYAPSGTAIVFTSDRDTVFLPDLWVMDPSGAGLERLRDRRYASTMPDWQPLT